MMQSKRRDPYVILGLPHGAPRDQIGRAFARATVAVRQGRSAWELEDLTWAKQEAERAAEDAAYAQAFLRVPASDEALAVQGGSALLTPRVTSLRRATEALAPPDVAAVEQMVLNEAALALLSDESVFETAGASWVKEAAAAAGQPAGADPFAQVAERNEISEETTPDALRFRAQDDDISARIAIARLARCPADILDSLAADPHEEVRAAVAANPAISQALLLRCSQDPSPLVRLSALDNPGLSLDACRTLLEDPDPAVSNKSSSRIASSLYKGLSADEARQWATSPHPPIREAVAGAAGTPPDVLVDLLGDSSDRVRESAAQALTPKAKKLGDAALLDRMAAASTSLPLREAIVANPATSSKTLKRLKAAGPPGVSARASTILATRRRRYRPWIIAGGLALGATALVVAVIVAGQSSGGPAPVASTSPTPTPSATLVGPRVVSVSVRPEKNSYTLSWITDGGSVAQRYAVEYRVGSRNWKSAGKSVQGSTWTVKVDKDSREELRKSKLWFRVGAVFNGEVQEWAVSEPVTLKKK